MAKKRGTKAPENASRGRAALGAAPDKRESGQPGGGQGRRDDVGISGVYPVVAAVLCPSGLVAQSDAANWRSYNGSLAGERSSALVEITRANVGTLREICTYDTHEQLSFQTGPLVIDGTMYFTTDTSTYAIDAANCGLRWRNSHPYSPISFLANNRGAAFLDGRLFRTSNDVHAYAIDAASGKTVWDVAIGDPKRGESAPMAPIAWQGMVFVGTAGGDSFGVTGRMYALDSKDGHVIWEFKTVPDTGAARRSWTKESATNPPTGGGIWTSVSLDEANGVLYVAAGNPAPDFVIAFHPGASLYTNAILALDAKSGRLLSYIQLTPEDFHDWDVSATPAVITTRAGKQLLAVAGKSGLYYGVDRENVRAGTAGNLGTMSVLHEAATTTRANAREEFSSKKWVHFCPGTQGGTEWNGPAYDRELNTVFVGAVDWCASVRLQRLDTLKGSVGAPWTGMDDPQAAFGKLDPKETWKAWVTAIDADNGSVKWKFRSADPILGGLVATASGLLFTGDVQGDVFALDSRTGKELWRSATHNSIGGGVITYTAGGRQYVAVAAGMKSPIWPVPFQSDRVIVYGLR